VNYTVDDVPKSADWLAKIRLPQYLLMMDPREFEQLVCLLFRRMGYEAEETPYVGDNGIDGFLYKDDDKFVLQCKRVKGSVGEPILRDLFGAMHATRATQAVVVTTGKVSDQARRWAADKPIRIIELVELQNLIETNFDDDIVPANFVPLDSGMCPRCSSPLRLVNSRRGKFIGCSGYPNCRYTRNYDPKAGLPWK
jgi:restriction system protein